MSKENNSSIYQSDTSSNNKTKVGFFNGLGYLNGKVEYEVVNGYAIVGDICLGTETEMEESTKLSERNDEVKIVPMRLNVGINNPYSLWPNGVIPYDIDSRLPDQGRINNAMKHWHDLTDITFVIRSNESDYVHFLDVGRIWSQCIGRRGGRQVVSLTTQCTEGQVIHEIGHVVGLYHEHCRGDRDSFVYYDEQNVIPQQRGEFNQMAIRGEDIGNYDYCSIMHYPKYACAIDTKKPTLKPRSRVNGCIMGQRNGLSSNDIQKVKLAYHL